MAQQTRKQFYLQLYRALIIRLSRGKFNSVKELDIRSKVMLKGTFKEMVNNYLIMVAEQPQFSEMTLRRAIFTFVNNIRVKHPVENQPPI